jgi:hypothetical protein
MISRCDIALQQDHTPIQLRGILPLRVVWKLIRTLSFCSRAVH